MPTEPTFGSRVAAICGSTCLICNAVFLAPETGTPRTARPRMLFFSLPTALSGAGPQVVQNSAGGFTIDLAIQLRAPLTLAGNGSGPVTFLRPIDGTFDITRTGTSTCQFAVHLSQRSGNRWLELSVR
jgi:hypothetical protein